MGGDIFDFGGVFVAVVVEMEVEDLELWLGALVRVVWSCENRELFFLWRLSQMSLERKMSNAGGHPLGIVMQADSLMEFLFFDGRFLGKVTGSKKEVVVVEMVVGIVGRMVLANLGVLMEVVILVQLMVRGWTSEMVVGVTEGVL